MKKPKNVQMTTEKVKSKSSKITPKSRYKDTKVKMTREVTPKEKKSKLTKDTII